MPVLLLLLGFVIGWLLPRNVFPWQRRLSAVLMRAHNNRALATALIALGAIILIASVLIAQ